MNVKKKILKEISISDIFDFEYEILKYPNTIEEQFKEICCILPLPVFIKINNEVYVKLGSHFRFINSEDKNKIDEIFLSSTKLIHNISLQNQYAKDIKYNREKCAVIQKAYLQLDKLFDNTSI
jgi:hypothetical protein